MIFNYKKARNLMVENQLRPNKIKDKIILDIFKNTPKEKYIPNNFQTLSYSDMDIELTKKRGYLKNLHIAQLLKYAEIDKNDRILHLGSLTGYVSVLLSNLCKIVYAVEDNIEHRIELKKNIKKYEIKNLQVISGSFKGGAKLQSSFDIIFIDSPIKSINDLLLQQSKENLGKIIMIEKINNYLSHAVKITKNKNKFSKEYLFDVFSSLELYKEKDLFTF